MNEFTLEGLDDQLRLSPHIILKIVRRNNKIVKSWKFNYRNETYDEHMIRVNSEYERYRKW